MALRKAQGLPFLWNRRTQLLKKGRHNMKHTYNAGVMSKKNWEYEYPGNPTGTCIRRTLRRCQVAETAPTTAMEEDF